MYLVTSKEKIKLVELKSDTGHIPILHLVFSALSAKKHVKGFVPIRLNNILR